MKWSRRRSGGVQIQVLTGSRAGERKELFGTSFAVGRDPESDLQFDPHLDLAVSGRHALFSFQDGQWFLSDRDSLNGTLLNGQRISGLAPLQNEDRIQFGEEGPTVLFRILLQDGALNEFADTRPHRRLLVLTALLSVALLVVGAVALQNWMEGRRYAGQVRAMQGQIDSILSASGRTVEELRGRNQSLAEALSRSREDILNVRNELDAAQRRGDSREIEALQVQLQEAQVALVRQQLAAAIDYEAIEDANRRAVAKVFVDFGDEITTATAFAVRPDGILITNRHVVAGASGTRRPHRIAVQFADSRQVWPARIVAVSQAEDLAALRVDNIVGDVPTISAFNQRPDTISSGQAVAVIGFPLGGANPYGEGGGGLARTTLTTGIIGTVSDEVLEVNGYGVEGSSGSPIFDGSGEVIGVLYGGRIDAGERTLHAVPAGRAVDLLRRVY